MALPKRPLRRRTALQLAGAVSIGALAGCLDTMNPTASADGSGEPTYGPWFEDANGYDGTTVDARESDSVTIDVGAGANGFAFKPAAIAVAPGTKVVWEWTGNGGGHTIMDKDSASVIEAPDIVTKAGHTHTVTVDESTRDVTRYLCTAHEQQGMKGALVVADPEAPLSEFEYEGTDDPERTGEPPETYGGWLDEVRDYSGVIDRTDADELVIAVGAGDEALKFSPTAVKISPDTTVTWGWTGQGGSHNVVSHAGPAELESEMFGEWGREYTFEFTDEHVGVTKYECAPHAAHGGRGVVEVVDE